MLRRDDLQLRMEIDGKQAISELGKQEMAAYEYRQELKQISEEQAELERESKKIDKIRERYEKLTKEIKDLEAAGKTNTKQFEQAAARLGKVSEQLRSAENAQKALTESQKRYTETSKQLDATKAKINSLRAEMGLAGMTTRQLRQHQKDLLREMDTGVTKGTARYDDLKRKLQEVNARIRSQKADVNGTSSAWSKMKTEIGKFGILALGYLGAQEVLGQVQNLIRGSAELSDAISDVQKTTGLAKDSVKELSEEFGDMNTRTAKKELLGMAEIAGRLGIQGRDDIMGFVKAANQVNVSLGDSLGDVETVMRDLGKLTSTYNIKEAYGIEESLLKVGSAINELGMASTANEGNIVDFTRRMGGIAPLAKITIQDIMGMGATLDALGQTSETSSTALSKLFVNMAKNSKEYARFAKMEVADFVKLMNEDANEAFLRVLEGVKDNASGITDLAATMGELGEEGGRVIGVLGTLANNTKMLREQQTLSNKSFAEGTSISEEYRVKNENLAASLAKVQRWVHGVFINSAFLGFLEKSIGKMADWVTGVDQATRRFQNTEKYVDSLDKSLPSLISRYDELSRYAIKNSDQQEEMRKIIEEVAKIVPTAVTEFDAYGKALDISTAKVREFTKAQQEALKIQNAEAIKEQKSELSDIEMEIQRINWALSKRDADGDLFKVIQSGTGLSQQQIKLTADEIRHLQSELTKLQDMKLGRTQILADLGDESAVNQIAFQSNAKGLGRAGLLGTKGKPESSSTPIVPDDEEMDKMLEKFKDFQEQVKTLENEAELSRMDKDSREIAQIEQKFQQLREKALEYHQKGYLDQEAYNQTIAEINALQDDATNQKIDEQSQVILDKRKQLQDDIELMGMEGQEKEEEQIRRRYDALIQQAEDLGLSTVELERLKLEAIAALNQEYDEKLLKQKQEKNEKQLRADVELRQAQIDMTLQYAMIAGQAIDLVGKKGGELTAFQKILGLVQIGIETGASIMKAEIVALEAASAGGPAAPAIYTGVKLSIIGSILSAAARAKDLFSKADVPTYDSTTSVQGGNARNAAAPSKKSFYFGGPTGDGMGFGDQWGEYAGYVHKHEYVIPQSVRQEPIVRMQIEPILEALRLRNVSSRSFYSGGDTGLISTGTSPTGGSTALGSDPEVKQLLRQLIAVQQGAKNRKVILVTSELEDHEAEKVYLKDRYSG